MKCTLNIGIVCCVVKSSKATGFYAASIFLEVAVLPNRVRNELGKLSFTSAVSDCFGDSRQTAAVPQKVIEGFKKIGLPHPKLFLAFFFQQKAAKGAILGCGNN